MSTDSSLGYHHVPSMRTVALLLVVGAIGLCLLAFGVQLLGGPVAAIPEEPLTAPFRWFAIDGTIG